MFNRWITRSWDAFFCTLVLLFLLCGIAVYVESAGFDPSDRTFYQPKAQPTTTKAPAPKEKWSKDDFGDLTFYRRNTKRPTVDTTTITTVAPTTKRTPKPKISCDKKPKPPSPEDIQEFLKLNPPAAKDVYESNGIFEGDMTGMKVNVDVGAQKILTPKEIDQETLRWPNKVIPYAFYEKIPRKVMMTVMDAMADMEMKTCIRFTPWTFEDSYLKISPGRACASDVGYSKGEHILSVNPGCLDDLGAIQHEIMHALGIIHEQSRPDRDQYVFVNFANIQPDRASQAQFYTFSNPMVIDLGVPYDYLSVMHYPMNAFAVDKNTPSIMPIKKDVIIGNRVEMSSLDIKRINRLYRCSDNPLDDQRDPIPKNIAQGYVKNFKDWKKLCDGNRDTPEGWDEDPDVCLRMCRRLDSPELGPDGNNLFNKGFSKQCLHKNQLCDGQSALSADVLQQPDTCRRYCRLGGYVAMPASAQCIHYSLLCDGQVDTVSGEDEDPGVCQKLCQSNSTGFQGQLFNSEEAGMMCLRKDWLCDGKHKGPLGEPAYCAKYCKDGGYIPVGDEYQCIHWRKLCDGRVDTVTKLDEDTTTCQLLCEKANDDTGGELFNLPGNMQCVSKRWLCDGTQHDPDGVMEQEDFCRGHCTGGGFIPTENNGQCLQMTNLCNGKFDVRNGWDENQANCVRFCKPTADYPPRGFRLQINNVTKQCTVVEAETDTAQSVTSERSDVDWNDLSVSPNSLKAAAQSACVGPKQPCAPGMCLSRDTGYECFCPSGYQSKSGGCVSVGSPSSNGKPQPLQISKQFSDTLSKIGISVGNQPAQSQSSVSRSGKAVDVAGSASSSSSNTSSSSSPKSGMNENIRTEFGYVLGTAEPRSTGNRNTFELHIPDRTHLLLYCKDNQVITTLSAEYAGKGAGCSALSQSSVVARKCDDLPVCGFIARDPSHMPGCGERELVIRYSCAAPANSFNIDLKTENMCNPNSTSDDVKETVQCNMSAISLIP
ncbi:uncharacterized protein LOC129592880 isoform X2 [Paramacrobiotus metropolitanus]|uniref:uncharacterized protein LOC129592880 isoform X2 n=1 Tax=Paramacrobiotus metropolitanus TaxID=2943436 RepID=UPI0024463233|nr:uncharacterized protein LOC129592880 isoform X2 [Paramacrobiotus metropolitanus]